MKFKNIFPLANFPLAGTFYVVDEWRRGLCLPFPCKEGDELVVEQSSNEYDIYALEVYLKERLIGYIPAPANRFMLEAMSTGIKYKLIVKEIRRSQVRPIIVEVYRK